MKTKIDTIGFTNAKALTATSGGRFIGMAVAALGIGAAIICELAERRNQVYFKSVEPEQDEMMADLYKQFDENADA